MSLAHPLAATIAANPLATRADAQKLVQDLSLPLIPAFSPGRAQVRLGPDAAHFDRKAAWFEGFARPLWGLAPLHAGGGTFPHWDLFRKGIVSGADPAHPEYWQPTTDRNQRSVEIAALGFALALAPDQLWEPLPDTAKANLAAWLAHVERVEMADNNWHFFPVMAGIGMERVGLAIDEASREAHLSRIEDFALDGGWYRDGPGGFIDHYNGFALHYYGLIYARHIGERDPARAARYVARASAFAKGFRHWFGRDGAALAMGRSLTYRFAMAGFWGALAYANVEALPWGDVRALWARQVRWWLAQPMLDASGHLSVGYRHPTYLMSEEYNSPGSPYWAFKAFLPLALPEDHPFWQAKEADLAEPERPVAIPGASMLVSHRGGDVTALPAGPVRTDMRGARDKYGKLAYSTRFGLCVEAERWLEVGFVGDNVLAASHDDVLYRARGALSASRMGDHFIETTWSPLAGVEVTTLQAFHDGWEVRLHRIATDRALTLVETGHAVPARIGSRDGFRHRGHGAADAPCGLALALDDGHRSALVDLAGTRAARAVDAAPNTSLTFPHAAVPALTGRLEAGPDHLLATAVRADFKIADGAWDGLPDGAAIEALAAAAGWPAGLFEGLARPDPSRLVVERRAAVE